MVRVKVGEEEIKLMIWDTAGQERYEAVATNIIKKADGVAYVYNINWSQSF